MPSREDVLAYAKAKGLSDADAAAVADEYLTAQKPAPKASAAKTPVAPTPSPAVTARTAPSPPGPVSAAPKAVASRALAAIERQERASRPQRLSPSVRTTTPQDILAAPLPAPKPGSVGDSNPEYAETAAHERALNARLASTMDNLIARGLTESPEALLAAHRSGARPIADDDLLFDLETYAKTSRDLDDTRALRTSMAAPRGGRPPARIDSVADLRREDRRELAGPALADTIDLSRRMAKAYMDDGPAKADAPAPPPARSAMAYDDAARTAYGSVEPPTRSRSADAEAALQKLQRAGIDIEGDETEDELVRAAAMVK